MSRAAEYEIYRCDLCHQSVDAEMRDRARRVWQPLIICERCVRGPERTRVAAVSLRA
jgi:hypothetical protein